MSEKTVAIVIPAYNEELTICQVMREFHQVMPEAQIVVVNNNSSDRTDELARQTLAEGIPGRVIVERRQGKAAAVRRAFYDVEADVYVMVDADCTYPAKDLPDLLRPVLDDEADIVVGNRHAGGAYCKENKRMFHNWGNNLVLKLINRLFNGDLKDILSGYRVMNRRFVKNYPIMSRGFGIETEMSIHMLDKGFRVVEIPTHYKDRPEGSFSKLNTIRDGVMILRMIAEIFIYYRPTIFFSAAAVAMMLLGLAAGIVPVVEFYQTSYITHLPLAVLAVGCVLTALLCCFTGIVLEGQARGQRFAYEHLLLRHERS
ncbi:MAG: glycosyltransferase [Akkermansiaceae bacterium]|nr:glycosyltransferase [Akkermansiaceae bacterium]